MLDQVLKIIERVLDSVIRSQVDIASMQFGFMPGWGTTDAIFILGQLQEKHLGKHKPLYFAFVNLEKVVDCVPRKVLWWAMRRVRVKEWVIHAVKAMYENAKSCVHVNGQFSDEFNIKVGPSRCCTESSTLHNCYGSLIKGIQSWLPLGIALRRRSGVNGRDFRGLEKKLTIWKDNISAKRLQVNISKTKFVCSKHNSPVNSDLVKWPCSICHKGVSINSIFCQSCNHWVHKRCSKIKGRLKADPYFKCNACINNIMTISQDDTKVIIGNDKFEVVDSCRYLGDSIGQSGSCFEVATDKSQISVEGFPQFSSSTDKWWHLTES